jgi:transposase
MIGPGTGVRVYLACGVTDLRKGITGLAAAAQQVLKQKPASGGSWRCSGRGIDWRRPAWTAPPARVV